MPSLYELILICCAATGQTGGMFWISQSSAWQSPASLPPTFLTRHSPALSACDAVAALLNWRERSFLSVVQAQHVCIYTYPCTRCAICGIPDERVDVWLVGQLVDEGCMRAYVSTPILQLFCRGGQTLFGRGKGPPACRDSGLWKKRLTSAGGKAATA